MKKNLIISLLLCLPLMLMAGKKKDDSKYLVGAVPEQNGIVTFQKSFSVTDKNTQQIYDILLGHLKGPVMENALQNQNPPYTRILANEYNGQEGTIVARIEEYMIFQKAFLSLDRARFRYLLSAEVKGQKVLLTLTQVSYYYNEDMDGNNGVTYKAEEWITDKEALSKDGKKLYPRSGKFRRKTVDRVQELFEGFMDAIAIYAEKTEKVETAAPAKVRKGIVED